MLNVYQFHNDPKTLTGYDEQDAVIPGNAYVSLTNNNFEKYPKSRLEKVISTDPSLSYRYARWMDKPFPLGEPAIATDIEFGLPYALDILKKRFPLFEPTLAEHPNKIETYLKTLVKTRVPVLENAILTRYDWLLWYLENIIKGRWPEAEPMIKKVPWLLTKYNDLLIANGEKPISAE